VRNKTENEIQVLNEEGANCLSDNHGLVSLMFSQLFKELIYGRDSLDVDLGRLNSYWYRWGIEGRLNILILLALISAEKAGITF
jgi:hypothetical protein